MLLIKQMQAVKEVSFDSETTGIDANNADLVGLSFSWKPGEAYYVPVPPEREAVLKILSEFQPLFENPERTLDRTKYKIRSAGIEMVWH